jgi:short-chain fatty acids transporter
MKWVPHSLIVALILNLIAFILALIWGDVGYNPITVIQAWGDGFWVLLTFAMQMCLILLTGYIVAVSPPVEKVLAWLANLPNPDKPWQAILLMGIVTNVLAYINWGLSIVGAAIFMIYLVRLQKKTDFRLLLAAAYLGLGCVWHMGLSASAPLMVPDPDSFLIKEGILAEPIPTNRTIFSGFNVGLTIFTVLFTAVFMAIMHPSKEKTLVLPPERLEAVEKWIPPEKPRKEEMSVADKLNWWPGWGVIFAIAALIWLVRWYSEKGFAGLTLNSVNLMFLFAGLLLHWYPARFVDAALSGANKVWGIIIQFPIYAGIFGMLRYTALAETITGAFVAVATARTYPLLMYWSAGIINYFVPSGGSEWTILAPIILPAGKALGVSPATVTLTYAWGDMATDVIQPFWAIALCEITGIKFREMMGYCVAMWIPYLIYMSIACLLVPLVL